MWQEAMSEELSKYSCYRNHLFLPLKSKLLCIFAISQRYDNNHLINLSHMNNFIFKTKVDTWLLVVLYVIAAYVCYHIYYHSGMPMSNIIWQIAICGVTIDYVTYALFYIKYEVSRRCIGDTLPSVVYRTHYQAC